MEKFFLVLMIFRILIVLSSENINAENSAALSLTVIPTEKQEPDAHDGIQDSGVSSKELTKIQYLAKNISHSKGIYQEGDEKKIRRSILRKSTFVSESDIMKNILTAFNSYEDKLTLLKEMEYMVHQYDVAINFANMGGMMMIAPLLFSTDEEIVASVALVLGAAMQGNPTVQKLAANQNIGRMLRSLLSHKSSIVVARVMFALSSFLRNSPDEQLEFFSSNGVPKLVNILYNDYITTSTKLKIINLFSDLALEQEMAQEGNSGMKSELDRSFVIKIHEFKICKHIASFLNFEDYDTHQRTVDAMLSLYRICKKSFQKTSIKYNLVKLMKTYDPNNNGRNPAYPLIDQDLSLPLYRKILILYAEVTEKDNTSYPYYNYNPYELKSEL